MPASQPPSNATRFGGGNCDRKSTHGKLAHQLFSFKRQVLCIAEFDAVLGLKNTLVTNCQ